MRVFQNKSFSKWAIAEGLSSSDLLAVIDEMNSGLSGNNLGGNIYKKRIGLAGRGKSAGVRTIIAYKAEQRAFFLYGFPKNERDNITSTEEKALKMMGRELFKLTDKEIEKSVKAGALIEIETRNRDGSANSKTVSGSEKKRDGKQNPKQHT
ncbi:MAG: type II toxin-antitoxin system RelE/ParE family toxin [Candidatus Competibacteraceae bacterium]|nr:type II toxin-antitoxin system RelE/ParE family toxin [Candidatus Competibacteraceae bacterium]